VQEHKKISWAAYILGGISFIPLLGVPFGIAAAIWGMVKWKEGGKVVASMGIGGIAFTIVLYSALFYFGFVQRGGVYDELRAKMAKTNLTQLVQSIEFYNLQNGHYPVDLKTLKESLPENTFIFLGDMSKVSDMNHGQFPYYHYELTSDGKNYYLLGTGQDNLPFTPDDILPSVSGGNIGLMVKP